MRYLLLLFGLCSFIFLSAQNSFVRNDQFIVLNYDGDTLLNPWVGGFNSVQFSEIDLDLDGIKDLFVFDRTGNKVSTFINSGIASQVSYRHAPSYSKLFPEGLTDWVLLRDFNCDGKMDIFSSSSGGVTVYKNISSTQLEFSLEKEQILFDSQPDSVTPAYTNLYIGTNDLPAIDDIDSDGDLDFLRLSITGARVEYLKNLSVEKYGTCDSLDFQIRNKCWGFVEEFTGQNKVVLYDTCSNNINNPEKTSQTNKHLGGSSFFTLDVDSNKTKELVIGGATFNNLLLLVNSDPSLDFTESSITLQQSNFPATYTNTSALKLDHFLAGFYLDINNDGVKDLISSTNAESLSSNTNNVWSYLNSNATDKPDFGLITKSFLQEGMIEIGSGAHPAFVDYNADGLMDMVIGNFGVFDITLPEQYVSSLWLYENIGTASVPAFQLVDSNYANISSLTLDLTNNAKAFVLSPAFGDVDGDGDQDMMLGDFSGNLHYFENTAGVGNVMNLVLNQAQYLGIDVVKNAAPQLVDLNRDGLLDLVVGRQDGYISYFENTGSSVAPVFTLVTNSLGMVNTLRFGEFVGNSSPFVYEVAGSYKILSGSESGFIYQFGNIDGNLTGTFSVDSSFQNFWEGISSTIAMSDINNDNMLDMMIGNASGGVAFYMGDSTFVSVNEVEMEISGVKIYPNPAKEELNINLGENKIDGATIQIVDVVGKSMIHRKVSQKQNKFNISKFPSGMYFVIYNDGINRFVSKLVKE
jgi:hypothetical protein